MNEVQDEMVPQEEQKESQSYELRSLTESILVDHLGVLEDS